MAKNDPVEAALARLGELRQSADPMASAAHLQRFLRHRSNLVVAKAAKVARELGSFSLLSDLVDAFNRFMADAPRLDRRCAAVTEIAISLHEFDYHDPAPYLAGLRHVQLEASYGPPVDEGAKLRAICAQGLLRTRYAEALRDVLPLLVDPEPAARIGAVRALATNGGPSGALLLRLKVLTGDEEPAVLGECFSGLLAAAPESSLHFVAGYIDAADDAIAEAATLALGDSRLPAACQILREKWSRTVRLHTRQTLLAAMAASRLDDAIAFLVELVESANVQTVSAALDALSIFRGNDRVRTMISEAVEKRGHQQLTERFRSGFS